MRTHLTLLGTILAASIWLPAPALAADVVPIHVFVRDGCVHCNDEKAFLTKLQVQRSDIAVSLHDLAIPGEKELFTALAGATNSTLSTPLTFINGTVIQGFATEDSTGKKIEAAIDRALRSAKTSIEDVIAGTVKATIGATDSACDETGETPCTVDTSEYLVAVPFLGTINFQAFSLPVIAAILGFVDGFNPCAMWVLVTFLLVLLQLGDRKKVWQVAGLFIAAETIMYYAILNVWFTTWDFIGLDRIVTPLVGLVAVGAGSFFLYEAITAGGQCKVTSSTTRKKTHLRISAIASMPFTLASVVAVIGLALSVNIIEFACSVGIPQTFTKILDLNNLSFLGRQGLMFLYILMYMVDDFLVFGLALWSTEHMHLTHKYSKICSMIGGALMIMLGSMLIFAPGWLVFG